MGGTGAADPGCWLAGWLARRPTELLAAGQLGPAMEAA